MRLPKGTDGLMVGQTGGQMDRQNGLYSRPFANEKLNQNKLLRLASYNPNHEYEIYHGVVTKIAHSVDGCHLVNSEQDGQDFFIPFRLPLRAFDLLRHYINLFLTFLISLPSSIIIIHPSVVFLYIFHLVLIF